MTVAATAKPKRLSAREEILSLRRQADEARARAETFRANVEALERLKANLIESAKRCGVDLESYAKRLEGGAI